MHHAVDRYRYPWTAGPEIRRVQVCVRRDPSDNPDVRISGRLGSMTSLFVPQSLELASHETLPPGRLCSPGFQFLAYGCVAGMVQAVLRF